MVATGDEPEEYTTSLIGNATLEWMRSIVSEGSLHDPFFAFVGPHAPHLPSTPPPYEVDPALRGVAVPKDPLYDRLSPDKHSFLGSEPSIDENDAESIAEEHTRRLLSLVAVDDVIRGIVEFLRDVGEWSRTIFLFTSDHGYSLGQNRILSHKSQVYDHNTRVPFIVAGVIDGRNSEGRIVDSLASMVDLAPTVLELCCGIAIGDDMDGISFASQLRVTAASGARPSSVLVEYQSIRTSDVADGACASRSHVHDGPNNTYSALRVHDPSNDLDLLYAEFADVNDPQAWNFAPEALNVFELYNVSSDYWMAKNIYEESSSSLRRALHSQLQRAIKCKGGGQCSNALDARGLLPFL